MEALSVDEWNKLIAKANGEGKKKRKPSRKLEAKLQKSCVRWFRMQYPSIEPLLFAVPNGGSRNEIEAAELKRQGVTPGVSDLILLVRSKTGKYPSLCIEMKAEDGSQSENQEKWQRSCEAAGNRYVVCRTLDSFMEEVNAYLKNV
jgi:hypothetical protein